jgi:hypothetical protein
MSVTGVKNIPGNILVGGPHQGVFSRIKKLVHTAEDRLTGDTSEIMLLLVSFFLIMLGLLKRAPDTPDATAEPGIHTNGTEAQE